MGIKSDWGDDPRADDIEFEHEVERRVQADKEDREREQKEAKNGTRTRRY